MNGLPLYLCASLIGYACISFDDAGLASLVNPDAYVSAVSSIADVVVSNDSSIDVNAISSGDFSSAKALVAAASNATEDVSNVFDQRPDPMVLTALSALLKSVISMNAASSYLGNNPHVIPVKQCSDTMKLTRNALPWPEGWGIVQDAEKPNYPGMLN